MLEPEPAPWSSSGMASGDYRGLLLSELGKRKSRNPAYSLRAFARDLGIGSTTLSDVLARRRHLSKVNVLKVAERLSLAPKTVERILREARAQEAAATQDTDFVELREDEFRIISDWYCFAILSLARMPTNRSDTGWIARRLGISELEARDAVSRLERLGYLEVRSGSMVRTALPFRTSKDVPSSALRNHHRQNLHRAERALEDVPVALREISSTTFAMDSSRIEEAKELIVAFRRRFSKLMETDSPDEVYTIAVQLFPTVRTKGEEK